MTETSQTLREDIAFMRALADDGVRPPLLAGPTMMTAGAAWGVSFFVAWVEMRFLNPSALVQSVTIITPMIVFLAALPFLIHRQKSRPGYGSPANRAVGMAWMGAGWGIFLLAGCTSVVCWRMNSGLPAEMIPSDIMVMYGVAWTVAAAMTKDRFLWATAIGSYLGALVLAAFIGSPDQYLAFAIEMILLAFVPGYVLWRREPKDMV